MNIKNISNQDLDQALKGFVVKEREILTDILLHIAEVDRRKLYLTFAYSSLFDYLTKHIGYSAGSAQRRIDAARLSKEIPEVISRLEDGSLNLAQVGLLQKSVRQSQSENKRKVSALEKKEIVEKLSGKSLAESQILVNQSLNISVKELTKTTHQQDESIRFELTLTNSQWQKLNQMRELLSNSLPNGSGDWDQVLEYVSDTVIAQKSPKERKKDETSRTTQNIAVADVAGIEVIKARVPLNKKVRDQVFERDKCCQFKDKHTGKMCGSKWRLHVDHVHPVYAGGSNEVQNLRILCANHNLELYRSQAGLARK